jgi:hypothetical protein
MILTAVPTVSLVIKKQTYPKYVYVLFARFAAGERKWKWTGT